MSELQKEIAELIWKAELNREDSVSVPMETAKRIELLLSREHDLWDRINELEYIVLDQNRKIMLLNGKCFPTNSRATNQRGYNRKQEWLHFNDQVLMHILEYTLVQYGNREGNEQVDSFTIEDCFKNIERYFNRRNASVRGPVERLRDVIKIAHYAQFIYGKLKEELEAEDVYVCPGDKVRQLTV